MTCYLLLVTFRDLQGYIDKVVCFDFRKLVPSGVEKSRTIQKLYTKRHGTHFGVETQRKDFPTIG